MEKKPNSRVKTLSSSHNLEVYRENRARYISALKS